ncbi:MAG: HEAT repeat domain-containing protein [Verrucomicrobiota bacterium]
MTPPVRVALSGIVCIASAISSVAQHRLGPQAAFEAPKLAAASDDGEKAIKRFQLPSGWKAELWATEPDVAHGVSFDIADDGRVFVVESFRAWRGVPDIRGIMDWLDEDLACRSVEDRLAMMERHLGRDGMKDYYRNTERIRLLTDPDRKGRATRSVVFAENFATPLDGVAAGVLARGKDVYFANIPNVWHLRDENLDGVADTRRSLSYGHGIRVGFLGHDLHGLVWGPDAKLYFSIGDRASMIRQGDKTIGTPDSGAVFRCNADGSELEMIYQGLRNPQELVFDEWGNLFTGDNNSDGGDQARWTYLIEGGDSGWRIGWQFLEQPNPRGPWNSEKMWHPQNESQPAYLTPPIKNITAGPSGVAYYPGTGLGPEWNGTFTVCDFRGSGTGSGIWAFKLRPKGATFEIVEDRKMIWSIAATDAAWGPDGSFWMLDWVDGWEPVGKGRVYRAYNPQFQQQTIVEETRKILSGGVSNRSDKELLSLLGHPNQRVRQAAQFELAGRGDKVVDALARLAKGGKSIHARLHAVWALGNIQAKAHKAGRDLQAEELDAVLAVIGDSDPHLRSAAARVLGDAAYPAAYDALVLRTRDQDSHVAAVATIALGKLQRRESVPAVIAVLEANADRDPFLRHAAVQALVGIGDFDALQALAKHPNASVRMGVLLAMRRLERHEIALFLRDSDPRLVLEAARAINDLPISGAMVDLAELIGTLGPDSNPALARRVINANQRFGTVKTAQALAKFSAERRGADPIRAEALDCLSIWAKNPGRDRITGLWRPTAFARDAVVPRDALKPFMDELLSTAPNPVRSAAAVTAGSLEIKEAAPVLASIVRERQGDATLRVAAIQALARIQTGQYLLALEAAQKDPEEAVRKAALKMSVEFPPQAQSEGGTSVADPTGRLVEVIRSGTLAEKQGAMASLGKLKTEPAIEQLRMWMNNLLVGKVQTELQLDVLDAASQHPSLQPLVERWKAGHAATKPFGVEPWKVCLTGGSAEEGRKVFVERAEVACVRCHKVNGEGGEVGPELTGLVEKQGREYVLQSIIHPNAAVAVGFESVLVTLKNGSAYAGIIKSETPESLEINSPEEGLVTVRKVDIQSREKGLSGMPEGLGDLLSRQDLRNLIEYLASAK